MTPQDFIAAIGPAAQTSAAQTNIPASFVVADAALESGWGSSGLTENAMNLFGVKADSSWTGPTYSVPTREYLNGQWVMEQALFREYSDWLGSIQDHAAFLIDNPRYAPAFACNDGPSFATAVANAGYATDPAYAQKIIEIINAHNLTTLDAPAAPVVTV
jgi:flagellar rod assembly protein/muramidase FlgJ